MKSTLAIFINGEYGLKSLRMLHALELFDIKLVILNSSSKQSPGIRQEVELFLRSTDSSRARVLEYPGITSEIEDFIAHFPQTEFGISIYFGHLIPPKLINKFSQDLINVHPSYLPDGRGAHPIAWAILERHQQGVTIHKIDSNVDTGDIYSQIRIDAELSDNAGILYGRCGEAAVTLLQNFIPRWVSGEFQPTRQSNPEVPARRSSEIENLRTITFDESVTAGDFIRRIQATTFSNGSIPRIITEDGKVWEIKMSLTKVAKLEKEE